MKDEQTIVTLDEGLAERVHALAKRPNISFDDAANAVIRSGLRSQAGLQAPYQVPTFPMGLRPGIDLTHALQLAGELEDEEILRKMQEHNERALGRIAV
ncbi:MAG TPA: hypothetical protein VFP05_02250, partial [Thermomicrobiales bacterium]|nr:hypothetical protein [Thermomicrobiales bacterium]